jgi:hypothetical protein
MGPQESLLNSQKTIPSVVASKLKYNSYWFHKSNLWICVQLEVDQCKAFKKTVTAAQNR